MTEKKTTDKRGGARPGAGRPVGWRKEVSEARPNQTMKAYDHEWIKINSVGDIVKHGSVAAQKALDEFIEKYKIEK